MKVALFGGSFNPIHNGHLEIARELVEKKIVDEVWFIPCGNHAFNKELIDGENRITMINLAIKDNPKLKAIGVELNDNKSYTSKTIAWFKKEFNHQFYFIIGADNLKDLKKWHDFEYLKENVEFILIKRPGFDCSNDLGINIKNILNIDSQISSSLIRENLKKKISIKNFVSKNVETYIRKERIYDDKS